MTGFVCGPPVYEFEGVEFEVHSMFGPHPLKKNGDPRVHIPKSFWGLYERFQNLTPEQKEACRIHQGGCKSF